MTRVLLPLFCAAMLLGGCASTGGNPRDPFEPMNRAVFHFNDVVDENISKPVAKGYAAVVPELLREGVTNFFSNLGDLWIGTNELLQGKVYEAASDVMRVSMNTIFGLGGLLDIASTAGLQKHDEDFGQTLGHWGVPAGPYLVIPVIGSSDMRDAGGLVVDFAGNPVRILAPWLLPAAHRVLIVHSLYVLYIINLRADLLTTTNLLDIAAVDRYSFVREAYLQRRRNQVYDGNPPLEDEEEPDDGPKAASPSGALDAPSGEQAVLIALASEAPGRPGCAINALCLDVDGTEQPIGSGGTKLAEP